MPDNAYQLAIQDFRLARQQAALQEILARFTGKSTALLSYEKVYRQLRPMGSAARGRREIPLNAIIGSVGRYTDFTRTFLPRQDSDARRWTSVMAAATDTTGLPPIEVYQIGEAYFVIDGHHRISVARQLGATSIEAEVIEVQTRVPLTPDVQPHELILKAELAAFLEDTGLDRSRPTTNFQVSELGQYAHLEAHIEAHRYILEDSAGQEFTLSDAAQRWHDEVYWPIVQTIHDRGVLQHFPQRTETDLYVWLVEHRLALEEELGWHVSAEAVAADLVARFKPRPSVTRLGQNWLSAVADGGPAPGQWRAAKLEARYSEALFADILVPLNGTAAGWFGLEQALVVAQRERAILHGLHVVPTEAQRTHPDALAVRDEFNQRCAAAGVTSALAIEVGEVAATVCERAVLADLVILNLTYPPGPQPLARLGSGFRAIIHRCPRPLLAVPERVQPLTHLLLAYDGSPKSMEALFVATYLADQWRSALVVVSAAEPTRSEALDRARSYLDWHEIVYELVTPPAIPSAADAILSVAHARGCDGVIMGGYGAHPMVEVVLGSTVDQLLRASSVPMLICR